MIAQVQPSHIEAAAIVACVMLLGVCAVLAWIGRANGRRR